MPRTLPDTDEHQLRLLARADRSADAAEAAVRRVWLELLRVIREGGPWFTVFARVRAIVAQLPTVAHTVATDLVKAHRDSATWTTEQLATTLPRPVRLRLLRRQGLLEREDELTRLLVGLLLPPLDEQHVLRLVYSTGWAQTFAALTSTASPESLAARIAAAVTRGDPVARIARDIRPVIQGVQADARRIARTAGLWVAHEAERDVYRGLEGDLIAGYTVRAVLDSRTRPEHRKRDGQQFWCKPAPGQRPMSECPHPPREADGSWAFNCRCWLAPILRVE